jgi:hypothetical protein
MASIAVPKLITAPRTKAASAPVDATAHRLRLRRGLTLMTSRAFSAVINCDRRVQTRSRAGR